MGFIDQFGGKNNKKYKGKAFKELLLNLENIPIEKQESHILKAFNNWKNIAQQVDDVCVMGVKIM